MKLLLATALTVLAICLAALGCGSDDKAAPPAVPDTFFGVVPQVGIGDQDLARMAAGNIGTLRFLFAWNQFDPTPKPGDTDFSGMDALVAGAAANHIQILPTLYATPDWVGHDLDGADCGDSADSCSAFAPHSKAALAAWKEWVGEVVDRYGPSGSFWSEHSDLPQLPIRTWQIWNEQNSPTFFQPKPDPKAYAALLSASADAIRKRDPGADVMLGGMFQTSGHDGTILAPDYLRELYGIDGATDDFDAVASHPYAHSITSIEDQVRLLHDEIDRAGDDADLWVTEIGASSGDGKNPLELGETGQADLLREAFNFFLEKRTEWNLKGVIWYAWRDTPAGTPAPCEWCANAGLFPADTLDPKPAWAAFVSFTGGT